MWRNHVATWAQANNSGRNLDLNKIQFSYLHCILQYSFWFGFESEKLESLYWYLEKTQGHSIGPLPWSRYAKTTLNHDKVSIYCALLTPQWKQSLRSSFMQVWETWSLKRSVARQDRQSRKFPPILIITEAKIAYFFVCKRTGFVHEELRYFVRMNLTRVSNHWLWLESSRVILWKTRLKSIWVTIFLSITRVESEWPKITTRVESLTRVTLSLVSSGKNQISPLLAPPRKILEKSPSGPSLEKTLPTPMTMDVLLGKTKYWSLMDLAV